VFLTCTGEAWDRIDALGDRIVNTLDAIKNTRAQSLRGLVAKARVADREYRDDGGVHSYGPHDAWMLVDDLLALGGVAAFSLADKISRRNKDAEQDVVALKGCDDDRSRLTFAGYDDDGAPLFRMEWPKSGTTGSDREVLS
jgi:hypothetical protein